MSDDPKEIYLQPACCAEYEGREWCDQDAWECEEGVDSTKYIRADLYEALRPASEWKEPDGPVLWWYQTPSGEMKPGAVGCDLSFRWWSRIPKVELPGEGA